MFPLTLAIAGVNEWLIILLIVVIFFGAAKIPQLARSLGRAKGEFERGSREGKEELSKAATKTDASADDEKVLKTARDLGIPTEGRPIADIKRDLRSKLS